MEKPLEGRVFVVTGASRGIGEAIALDLARAGAKVALAARKIDGLEAVAKKIESEGGRAIAVACHTGKPEEIEALVETTLAKLGRIDGLVNNAATNPFFGPMMSIEWAAWDKTFEVNVKGYFALTRAVVEHLEAREAPGSIINIASIVGLEGAPLQGVYAMTKAAVISMTQTLAVELGRKQIRVNAIAPGFIATKFSSALTENEQINEMIVSRTPLGRVGRPEEIGQLAVYLASDASSFVTGATFVADGGLTLSSVSSF